MPNCTSCGSTIPEGQGRCCSMCYGDIDYGKDGYYRDWAEHQSKNNDDCQDLVKPSHDDDLPF